MLQAYNSKYTLQDYLYEFLENIGVHNKKREELASRTGYSDVHIGRILRKEVEVGLVHIMTFIVGLNLSPVEGIKFLDFCGFNLRIFELCDSNSYYYELLTNVELRPNIFTANEYLKIHGCQQLGGKLATE